MQLIEMPDDVLDVVYEFVAIADLVSVSETGRWGRQTTATERLHRLIRYIDDLLRLVRHHCMKIYKPKCTFYEDEYVARV